jgi:hypothetical protein
MRCIIASRQPTRRVYEIAKLDGKFRLHSMAWNRLESSLKFRGREEVVARQDQGGAVL